MQSRGFMTSVNLSFFKAKVSKYVPKVVIAPKSLGDSRLLNAILEKETLINKVLEW